MREKINAKVLFDEDGWLRLQAEVPKVRNIKIISIEAVIRAIYIMIPSIILLFLSL